MNSTTMKPELLSEEKFTAKLNTVPRMWDGEEGIGMEQARRENLLRDCTYILQRNDGWSIACSKDDFDSCWELWKNQWAAVYQLGGARKMLHAWLAEYHFEAAWQMSEKGRGVTYYVRRPQEHGEKILTALVHNYPDGGFQLFLEAGVGSISVQDTLDDLHSYVSQHTAN